MTAMGGEVKTKKDLMFCALRLGALSMRGRHAGAGARAVSTGAPASIDKPGHDEKGSRDRAPGR